MKVKAINLKVGDKLSATDSTVVVAPVLANPAGIKKSIYRKTDIVISVKYANGLESVRVWNKNTEIKIDRPETLFKSVR